jgi:hypothetical protein
MGNQRLEKILELEELGLFEEVYKEYNTIFVAEDSDFEIWKFYYFFLWTSYEDASVEFYERIEAENKLQKLIQIGISNFSEKAEFNFLAGYTISIFPYIYGEYKLWEQISQDMLQKAFNLEPQNQIYEMIYLGCGRVINTARYNQCHSDIQPIVVEKYSGIGYLNRYFRQVLKRKN